jgi:hypothetical protein
VKGKKRPFKQMAIKKQPGVVISDKLDFKPKFSEETKKVISY